MSQVFYSSDTHIGHKNVISFSRRPFESVEEMNEALITNWNNKIKPNDQVYHLGDVLWFASPKRIHEVLSRLNGNIHLIVGNHDKLLLKHAKARFQSVQYYAELKINNQHIVLSHYPMMEWNGSFKNSWHLHGHCHNQWPESNYKRLDVGVDGHNYAPWSFEEIKEYMAHKNAHHGLIYTNPRNL